MPEKFKLNVNLQETGRSVKETIRAKEKEQKEANSNTPHKFRKKEKKRNGFAGS